MVEAQTSACSASIPVWMDVEVRSPHAVSTNIFLCWMMVEAHSLQPALPLSQCGRTWKSGLPMQSPLTCFVLDDGGSSFSSACSASIPVWTDVEVRSPHAVSTNTVRREHFLPSGGALKTLTPSLTLSHSILAWMLGISLQPYKDRPPGSPLGLC